MFDMPVVNPIDRSNAAHFRKYLLNHGYTMLQYSVYCRIVKGVDMAKDYERKLKANVPDKGSIISLTITEKQYENMDVLVGNLPKNDKKVNTNQLSTF